MKIKSKPFSATPTGSFLYKVGSQYERHVVDLVKKTCNCRSWDLNGIPCKHAITAIYTNIEIPEDYTHLCYFKETYIEIYKEVLPPMPGQSEWAETGQPAPRHLTYTNHQADHPSKERGFLMSLGYLTKFFTGNLVLDGCVAWDIF